MKNVERNPWKTLAKEVVYENPWIRVTSHKVLSPLKKPAIYGTVQFKNVAVGIVALDSQKRVLLVGQYRFPLKEYSWELPEGGCPQGEKTLASAKRELREETGYTAKSFKRILKLHLSNSVTDERAEIFLAEGLTAGESSPEESEVLQTKWVSLKLALRMIERGEITDAITVAGLLKIADRA